MNRDDRFWGIAGTLVLLLWLLLEAFDLGKAYGARPNENEKKAIGSLGHALEVIERVDTEEDAYESMDTLMDDIRDALAWMEKRP